MKIMAYRRTPTNGRYRRMSGLGQASNCGPDQQYDPLIHTPAMRAVGLPPGQCVPRGATLTPAPKPGIFDTIMSLFAAAAPVTPVAQPGYPGYPYPMQSQGLSQNTMIALGLGAVGLLAVVLATRNK